MKLEVDLPQFLGNASCEVVIGLLADTQIGASGVFNGTSPRGAALVWRPSDTEFQLYTCAPGGSPVYTPTGITSLSRFGLYYDGLSNNPDGVARVILTIDGAAVVNKAVSFSQTLPADVTPYFPSIRILGSGSNQTAIIGILEFAAKRYAGNVTA
jgi:hypothetical protein